MGAQDLRDLLPLDHLEIAVVFDGLLSVMEAAGQVDPRAEELLFRTVPPPLMEAAGFFDPGKPATSPRFDEALEQARTRLVDELPTNEGVKLCRRLWTMAAIDGAITDEEIAAVHRCARILGVDDRLADSIGVGLLRALARRGEEVLIPQAWVDSLGHADPGAVPLDLSRTVELPPFERAHAFTGKAENLVGGEGAWLRLQTALSQALWTLAGDTGRDLAAYCCLYTVFDEHGAGEERLSFYLAHTGTAPGRARLLAAAERLVRAGFPMDHQGEQPLPEQAFPTQTLVEGELLQLWLASRSGPVALGVKRDMAEGLAFIYGVEPHTRTARHFVEGIAHALVA